MNTSNALAANGVAGAAAVALIGLGNAFHVSIDSTTAVALVTLATGLIHWAVAYIPPPKAAEPPKGA